MKAYTLGFIFSPDLSEVFLIRKTHPEFQVGLLNGVGGKVETGESYIACMEREGREEAGYSGEWHGIGQIHGNTANWGQYQCEVFYSIMEPGATAPHTCEEEQIETHPVADPLTLAPQMVPHLPMLIMAALTHHAAKEDGKFSLDVTHY
jgi:8-oxo-dGTP diphosphatase